MWIDGATSTGVDAIDYRVTDRILDPPTESGHYTEAPVHVTHCYWCYSVPPLPDSVLPKAERAPGPPTFGCLNNFAKVSDVTLELWGRLLRRVPESRLLVYARAETHRDRVRRALHAAGVETSRAGFVGYQTLADYLGTYRQIDIALDPHPYGGGTTTCDALWMGVPVVSLAGRTAVSRAGATLLTNVGLERLVAQTASQSHRGVARHGCAAIRARPRGRFQDCLAGLVRAIEGYPEALRARSHSARESRAVRSAMRLRPSARHATLGLPRLS